MNNDNVLLQSIFEYVKRIDYKLDKIENLFKNGNQNNTTEKLKNDFLSLFPMKETAEITNIELKLKNSLDFAEQCVSTT